MKPITDQQSIKASTSQHLTIKYTHIQTINPILHIQSYVLCMQTGQQVSGRDIALWPGPQGAQVVICKITICKDNVWMVLRAQMNAPNKMFQCSPIQSNLLLQKHTT